MSEEKTADRGTKMTEQGDIPEQTSIPWSIAISVSWGSLKRRIFRSLITMSGVILAIAFLTYMLVTDNMTKVLITANIAELNDLLQKAGVDILAATGTDKRMILLISLALLTCLVGIINAMLMSVTERIKEIGTMKCLGALNSFILKTYFIESSLQGLMGTVIGIALGLLVGFLVMIKSYGLYTFQLLPTAAFAIATSLVMALFIGTIISVVAAIAPANWAATKEPVEAMRVQE